MDVAQPPRKRDGAATREAILAAAVVEFTEHGYTRAGVRQIAERAGVTAMMINRYFGSKDRLFAEAVDRAFGPPTVVGDERDDLSQAMARALAERTGPGAATLDPFLLLLRSAQDPEATDILRRGIETHVGARLAGLLRGPETEVRAQLGLALVAGTWLLRTVVGTTALAEADDGALADLLTAMLRPLTDEADSTGTDATGTDAAPSK
ncbi:TetR/AcrR family transcriptional regulator [Streptomyces sp. NPDC003247]|uniref:TetR/AcrR family transcriptional regulator n=1 Tax=Streptomyces sp. NPDC003247 TaxID=3364677 RepID=UPI003696AD3B